MLSGKVVDTYGISGVLVGVKSSPHAVADAIGYAVTDSTGNYKISGYPGETFYLAAWKSNYRPTKDYVITVPQSDSAIADTNIVSGVGNLLKINSRVAASSTDSSSSAAKAVDGYANTGWISALSPSDPVYYYIDLGTPTGLDYLLISCLTKNGMQCSADDYQIDVMSDGNPLDPASWQNNSTVRTTYSATKTIHGVLGYATTSDIAPDIIRFGAEDGANVRGIRIKFTNSLLTPVQYSLNEVSVYSKVIANNVVGARSAAVNSIVCIRGNQLTYLPGGLISGNLGYIEATDRSSGIKLDLSKIDTSSFSVGDTVDIIGKFYSSATTESVITVDEMNLVKTSSPTRPLFMVSRNIGGRDVGLQAGIWSGKLISTGVSPVSKMNSLNNTGLLIKVFGKVTQIDSTGQYFYIDDCSGICDGSKSGTESNVGIRVNADGRSYTRGQYLTVTGISSCFNHTDNKLRSMIQPILISKSQ